MHRLVYPCALLLGWGLLASGPALAAEPDLAALGTSLARLRAEVDTLSTTVERDKERARGASRTAAARLAELDLELGRERLRLTQLRKQAAELARAKADRDKASAALGPAVVAAVATIRAGVAATLPFHKDKRLAALDQLATKARTGSPARALAQLWAQVDDELRLTRGCAVDQQEIPLDGGRVLARVLRVGTAMLFFEAPDGRVGQALRGPAGWRWQVLAGEQDGRRLRLLFDAFHKGIRAGWFELPWSLGGA